MYLKDKPYPLIEETSVIIGLAMEVHKTLGKGFSEIVYKDALQYEFEMNCLQFEREKEFLIEYKNKILSHKFYADFIAFNAIIIEVKAKKGIIEDHYAQAINYLAASKCKVGLILNFGEGSLVFRRVIL